MKRDQYRREGVIPEEKLRENLISSFGGEYLKKNGWKGTKLNYKTSGLLSPIAVDYRHPMYRGGLGYYGKKLVQGVNNNSPKPRKKENSDKVIKISTIYDEPSDMEMYQNLPHRRRNCFK